MIANPKAGGTSARRLATAIETLRDLGHAPAIWYTRGAGQGRPLAARAAREGAAVVVAAGGDGTIAEVVAGILDACPTPGPDRPAVGLIPLGTVNVLARDIGLKPRVPRVAARVLDAGHRRLLRPARLNGRPFVAMASTGIDSEVVRCVDGVLKHRAGAAAYLWALLSIVPRYAYPVITATLERPDGSVEGLTGALVLVTRSRFYGGSLTVAPTAEIGAPDLHVVVVHRPGAVALAGHGLGLLTGRFGRGPGVSLRTARRVTVEAAGPLPVQADGDLAETLPAAITLDVEDGLDLIAPMT
ncbi:diacylglycerol kinase family protein [Roseospira navarrensis]|uniref:diacylglycerol kinase family protein n=1 Tax=Roseospira navarrensis TaxID=140058 RepID=UPI0014782919